MALVLLFMVLIKAWTSTISGSGWVRNKEQFGVRGWVRTLEATHGEHGWHLHVHVAVIFDEVLSQEMMNELGVRMFNRWASRLHRLGFSAVQDKGGLDVRRIELGDDASVGTVSDYLAKITCEMTSPSTKDGRFGNRAPFAILRDALNTGLADDCDLWLEWEKASSGRKQLTWSKGLREWAGLYREDSDEEIVAQDEGGQDVLVIPAESWPSVRPHVASLLDAVEIGGVEGGVAWMTVRGLAWSLPRGKDRGSGGGRRE